MSNITKELKGFSQHPDLSVLEKFLKDLKEPDVAGDYRDIGAHYLARREVQKELEEKFKHIRLLTDD